MNVYCKDYIVVDLKTGRTVGQYKKLENAERKCKSFRDPFRYEIAMPFFYQKCPLDVV